MIQKKFDCISEVLEIEITPADLSRSLDEFEEWDSISILGLMAKADEDFGIALTPDALEAAQTMQDLINLLEKFDDK